MGWLVRGAMILTMLAAPLRAEWRQARTDHFILTIEDSEEGARAFATRLERFDSAMRRLYGVADNPDAHYRPLAIYAMRQGGFEEICGCPGTVGYYVADVAQSFILVLHLPASFDNDKVGSWNSQALLLHEYSHHFAASNFPVAYPYWFSEGFAEFNANTRFEEDGSLVIGFPANYRGAALKSGTVPTPKQLFDPEHAFSGDIELIYARGWLLTHYLMLDPQRRGQLAAYLAAINQGKPSLNAAQAAFGDLNRLNAELETYRRGLLLAPLRVPPSGKPIDVAVTTLSKAQAADIPLRIQLLQGIAHSQRLGFALAASKNAARFPDDAEAQALWAEAGARNGRYDLAEKAADAALAINPKSVEALDRKGLDAVKKAQDGKGDAAAWAAARAWYLKANRADPNAVMPLYLYYDSFLAAHTQPTPGAVKALMRAEVLAPESDDVRALLARQMLIEGDGASARRLLQPAAFTPHSGKKTGLARRLVDLIDAGRVEEAKAALIKSEADAEKVDGD